MLARCCLLLTIFPFLAQADGALVMQPQSDGFVKIHTEGSAVKDALTFTQKAGSDVTVQIMPAGSGRCAGGDIAMETLHLSFKVEEENYRLACGESTILKGQSQPHLVTVRVETISNARSLVTRQDRGESARILLGNVTFSAQDGDSAAYPIYLDLSVLAEQSPMLSAAFDKPSMRLGMIGELNNITATARLRITKTKQAGEMALPYTLSFESSQQLDGQYRLRASGSGSYVPYNIGIGGKDIAPGTEYRGQLAAGSLTTDILNIDFSLQGKVTRGLAAGERLLDTVTAVITPGS